MQEESAGWQRESPQDIHQRADGFDAMDGERTVKFDGQGKLLAKGLLLRLRIKVLHPSVQSHFTHGGFREGE
jgi:hypothetical protein